MRIRLPHVLIAVAPLCVVAGLAGCLGGGDPYARYQHRGEALKGIDALVAEIPQYPGARRVMRQDFSTSYKVAPDRYVEAEPYTSALYYDLSRTVAGNELQRHFRRELPARGWMCRFRHRRPGVPYGFTCQRGRQRVNAYIADHAHYELDVQANAQRAPISTVPGD